MADVFKNLGFVEDSAPQTAPKSDPFAGLGFVEDKPAEEAPSSLEAGMRGLGQGASLGFLDEGAGALGALGDKLSGNDASLLDLYTKHRDAERQRNEAAKAAHPYLYGGGNIAGSIGSLALGGGALGLGKLGLVARGALEAGAMGLGDSKADLTQGEFGQSAKDTLMSASTGALLGKAGEVAAPYLQKAANNQAVQAVGAKLKDLRKMVGTSKVQEMGQAINDAGIMRPIGFGATAEDAYGRLADKTEEIGQKIGQGVQDLDDSGVVIGRSKDIAQQVKNKAATKLEDVPSGKSTLRKLGNYLDNDFSNKGSELITPEREAAEEAIAQQQQELLGLRQQETNQTVASSGGGLVSPEMQQHYAEEALRAQGKSPIALSKPASAADELEASIAKQSANLPENDIILTPKKAWEVRKGIDHDVNWNPAVKDMPDYQQGLVSTRNELQQHLLAAAPEGGELAQNMRQYHLLESAENMAKDQTARGMANRSISPSDYISGVGGLVTHGVPGAAALGALNHIARTRGSQTAAWGLTNLSQLLAENPQAYGRFSGPLLMAAKRGTQALAASHFILQQSEPAYRAINEAYTNAFNNGSSQAP